MGLASIIALPKVITAYKESDDTVALDEKGCAVAPTETVGPFLIKHRLIMFAKISLVIEQG